VAPLRVIHLEFKMSNEFTINEDGTVLDRETGLMWKRCAEGQYCNEMGCIGNARGYTWEEAMLLTSPFAGYEDWRLPTIKELKLIITREVSKPYMNRLIFPDTGKTNFWSSSDSPYYSFGAFYLDFNRGYPYYDDKSHLYSVRMIRGQQAIDGIPFCFRNPSTKVSEKPLSLARQGGGKEALVNESERGRG